MLTVTATAKAKLKEALQKQTIDPEVATRIIPSSSMDRLELVLDKEREGDQVVQSEEGTKLLLIGLDLVPSLRGMILDYEETGFTISKLH